jgi:hypothetical protein
MLIRNSTARPFCISHSLQNCISIIFCHAGPNFVWMIRDEKASNPFISKMLKHFNPICSRNRTVYPRLAVSHSRNQFMRFSSGFPEIRLHSLEFFLGDLTLCITVLDRVKRRLM